MATNKSGGEIDAFCTKCRMTLAHTILAMVGTKVARVRCNTCMGDHAYRTETASNGGRVAAAPRAPKAEKIVITFEQQLAGKDVKSAPKYSPKDSYAVDQLLNHPTFGIGIVTAVREDKIEVAFKADSKTLVHGRGGGGARPAFVPPAARSSSPADKPLPPEHTSSPADAGAPPGDAGKGT